MPLCVCSYTLISNQLYSKQKNKTIQCIRYAPKHPVPQAAIIETLTNLAQRTAKHVYDISFWSYYNAWRNSPYNQSYTPGWGEAFGGRIRFQDNDVKDVMVEGEMHWVKQKQIWHSECL